MPRSIPERSQGFALILVIWSLVIMLGLSAGFAMAVRHEIRVANDLVDAVRIDATTLAARNLALLALNHREDEIRWLPDGQVRRLQHGGLQVAIRVRSETGRIDLNRAPRPVLIGLFEQIAPERDPEQLADTLIDWRDRDERRSEQGAELADYRAAGLDYGPANEQFRSIHALSQVLGFDADVVETIAPYVTVHSRRPRINAMSAEPIVLTAIPTVDRATAEQFVEARSASLRDGTPPPVDLLRDGRRFIEMQLDTRVLLMDIAVLPPDRPVHLEQVVLGRQDDQGYALLSREPLRLSGVDPWWAL